MSDHFVRGSRVLCTRVRDSEDLEGTVVLTGDVTVGFVTALAIDLDSPIRVRDYTGSMVIERMLALNRIDGDWFDLWMRKWIVKPVDEGTTSVP